MFKNDSVSRVSGFWIGLCSQTFQKGSAVPTLEKHCSPVTIPWNVTSLSSWHWGLAIIIKKVQVCWQFKLAWEWHDVRQGDGKEKFTGRLAQNWILNIILIIRALSAKYLTSPLPFTISWLTESLCEAIFQEYWGILMYTFKNLLHV